MKSHVCFFIVILILSFVFSAPAFSQQAGSEITKYTIKDYLEANLPPQQGRRIALDEITGLLTITDTPTNQQLARKLIKEWDVPQKQVEIEAKFIEITFTDLDEMGVDWQAVMEEKRSVFDFDTDLMGTAAATSHTFGQAATAAGMGLFIRKFSVSATRLASYIKALEQSGKANLLHAPRITTLSGQMANIQVVRSFPYATSAERTEVDLSGSTTLATDVYPVETYEIEEELVGILLEVTPTVIEGSDIITLDIHPEVTKLSQQIDISSLTGINSGSSLFPSDLGWPIIDSRSANTSVMLQSGESIVIGGLIQDQDSNTVERKIPILGDMPLVGPLFRYKYENREKKNLVIFLSAKLVDVRGEKEALYQ